MANTPRDPLGGCPRDEVDCFGAHVGLTLRDLDRLRTVRRRLGDLFGESLTLTDTLRLCVAQAYARYAPGHAEAERPRSSEGGDTPPAER